MNPRDVTPKVHGFPGLPPWLDLPLIKRIAKDYGVTEEEAREHLRLNTIRELEPCKRRDRGQTADECRADACLSIDRDTLSKEPRDAPEISQEDGW
ncbi:hypothetical protein LCGC14_2655080 [marine sediment metagenome]|uniref:Uncharacterized protein n=1 Tax=marine sediment metagenome TaxID=412755 RepID=A0A0F9AFX8_9ZZZZ